MKTKLLITLSLLFILSCAAPKNLLSNRGYFKEQKETSMQFNKTLPDSCKSKFINGNICVGMTKSEVNELFRTPSNNETESVWSYDLKGGKIGVVMFDSSGVVEGFSTNLMINPEVDDSLTLHTK